jgi:hypothetical protein
MDTPNERATRAAAAWGLAKRRNDEGLRAAALGAYREARRAERAERPVWGRRWVACQRGSTPRVGR